jgi:hypothetical protein
MSGSVIERVSTTVRKQRIVHQDRLSTFERADALVGHRVDRRRSYAIVRGKLCTLVTWSGPCSGCYESGYDYPNSDDRGMGCRECGHQGRVRNAQWVPYLKPEGDDV